MRPLRRFTSSPVIFGALLLTIVASDARMDAQAVQDEGAPKRVFALAEKLELDGKTVEAIREYRTLIEQFPGSAVASDAMFRIAVEAWSRRDAAAAGTAAAGVVGRHPGSSGAAGAMVLQAVMQLDTAEADAGVEDAVTTLRRLRAILGHEPGPSREWGAIGSLVLGDVLLRRGATSEALGAYITAAEGNGMAARLGRLGLARALLDDRQWNAAAHLLQQVMTDQVAAPQAPAAKTLNDLLRTEVSKSSALAAGVSPLLDEGTDVVAAHARRLATLVHRHHIGPAAGTARWTNARRLPGSWREPVGVAASAEATVMVVDEGARHARVVSADGKVLTETAVEDGRRPWFDTDGTAYVAAEKAVYPASGQRLMFSEPQGNSAKPLDRIISGLRDRFGAWLILDAERRSIVRFSRDRTFRAVVAPPPNTEPIDAAADGRGRVYLLDAKDRGSIWRYDAIDRAATRLVRGEWRRPEALAIDMLGQIYVLDRDARIVEIYDYTGKRTHVIGPNLPGGIELRSPRDIAVDGSGRLYIADRALAGIVVLE